jgi:site-specific DNA-cytosine methylase
VDNPFESPIIISLCTGMRGLERGIERAIGDITIASYVEIEAFIIFNLVRQMEQGMVDAAPVWTDLKTFPAKQFHGKIHGIIGGYPCQPFSTAGKQKGEEDPRHLWPFIRRHVYTIKPVWCFFENVANHLNLGFESVYNELSAMGYAVEAGIYTASEVGAPHQRKRLFILAVANAYGSGLWRQHIPGVFRKTIGTSTELANTKGSECEVAVNTRTRRNRSTNIDTELANTSDNQRGLSECEPKQGRRVSIESHEANGSSKAMANSNSERKQLQVEWQQSTVNKVGSSNQERGVDQFPAEQGNFQYDWEEPRTVESGVGCTINGYNFKEDLLRMYGNGVVEQVAELAFIDLLNKHFK